MHRRAAGRRRFVVAAGGGAAAASIRGILLHHRRSLVAQEGLERAPAASLTASAVFFSSWVHPACGLRQEAFTTLSMLNSTLGQALMAARPGGESPRGPLGDWAPAAAQGTAGRSGKSRGHNKTEHRGDSLKPPGALPALPPRLRPCRRPWVAPHPCPDVIASAGACWPHSCQQRGGGPASGSPPPSCTPQLGTHMGGARRRAAALPTHGGAPCGPAAAAGGVSSKPGTVMRVCLGAHIYMCC